MKIVNFNISIKINNANEVANYLKNQNAEIICLQEVVRPLEDGVVSIFRSEEVIRKALKKDYPYYFFAPEWVADIHYEPDGKPDRIFGGMAEQGKMILSKYPITHGYNYFYHKNYEFDRERKDFYLGNDHGRALQVCEINIDGKIIQVGNVHGVYTSDKKDTEKSLLQSSFIIEKLKEKKIPTILLGDFNLLPSTKSMEIIGKNYKNINEMFKVSSTRPDGKLIDYIFTNKEFLVKSLKAEKTDISDHYPLIAELELK